MDYFGTAAPDDGVGIDGDLYWKEVQGRHEIYQRENGSYVLRRTLAAPLEVQVYGQNILTGVRRLFFQNATAAANNDYYVDGVLQTGILNVTTPPPGEVDDVIAIGAPTPPGGLVVHLRGVLQVVSDIHAVTGPALTVEIAPFYAAPVWEPITSYPEHLGVNYEALRITRTDTSGEVSLIHITRKFLDLDTW